MSKSIYHLTIFLLFCLSASLTAQRPNVLWITLEDTSPHFIGAYGNRAAVTPNIDRLAREGVKFNRAFAPAPVCAIARNALISGVSPNKMGTGHHRSAYPIPDFIRGYPAYLRDQGYYTSNNYKTDYNTSRADSIIADSWDECSGKAGWEKRAPGQPFFSVFNMNDSHQSRTMTHPRKWYEAFVLDKLPEALRTDSAAVEVPPIFHDSPTMRRHLARVQNSINYTDMLVGQLLDRLEADGLRDSTIIFVYADHGEAIPGGKCTATGLGYRVPFLIWFPPAFEHLSPWRQTTASEELLAFQDLGPTLISLAGGDIPDYMDGRAILGPARSAAPEVIYLGRNRLDETPDLARSVTDGRYLYTRNFFPQYPPLKPHKYIDVADIAKTIRSQAKRGELNDVQRRLLAPQPRELLYDLQQDPWEINNLATAPQHQRRLRRMRKLMARRVRAEADVHFLPEGQLATLTMPYDFRQDRARYPIGEVLKVAMADPTTKKGQRKLTKASTHANGLLRYWAAATLGGEPPTEKAKRLLATLRNDTDLTVAALAAGAELRYGADGATAAAATAVLRQALQSDDAHQVLVALQQIQYTGDFRPTFVEDLQDCLPRLRKIEDGNMRYNTMSCAETTLFLEGAGELTYGWMRDWE